AATQDIVIDAYRVESLSVDEQAAGMAGYVAAYRIGTLISGAGVIGLTAWLETLGFSKAAVWPIAYALAALLVLVGLLAVLAAREPNAADAPRRRDCARAAFGRAGACAGNGARLLLRVSLTRRGAGRAGVRRPLQAVRRAGRSHDRALRADRAQLRQGNLCGDRQRLGTC